MKRGKLKTVAEEIRFSQLLDGLTN